MYLYANKDCVISGLIVVVYDTNKNIIDTNKNIVGANFCFFC